MATLTASSSDNAVLTPCAEGRLATAALTTTTVTVGTPTTPTSPSKKGSAPKEKHIIITTHPGQFGVKPVLINWNATNPLERGPIVGTLTNLKIKNAIGLFFCFFFIVV